MSKLEIIITSVPDRENLVAEIWHEEKMLAEVSNENGTIFIELYEGRHIILPLDEFLNVFKEAKRILSDS